MTKNNEQTEKFLEEQANKLLNFAQNLKPLGMSIQNEYTYGLSLAGNYKPKEVSKMINNAKNYQKELRDISKNLIATSPQYQSLVEVIPKTALFRPVVVPMPNKNGKEFNKDEVKKYYIKASNQLSKMNIQNEFLKALLQMAKYDTFYGYEIENSNTYFIKSLNPDQCKITSFDSCINFAFDFSYFNGKEQLLKSSYPEEFAKKYMIYKNSGYSQNLRWQELDPNQTICTKWFSDELSFSLPPYVSLFDDIYNLKEYKGFNKDKIKADLLKMLVFKIPMSTKGERPDDFLLSLNMIQAYMKILDEQLPDSVEAVTSPMDVTEIKFAQNGMAKEDEVLKSEKLLFSSSGFAPSIFGIEATGSGLEYATKYVLGQTYAIYRQFETWLNRKFTKLYGGRIAIKLLDITTFNEDKVQEQYLKGSQMSAPCKTLYTAAIGLEPSELIGLTFLENEVLNTHEEWKPLNSSHTQNNSDAKSGRPESDIGTLSDAGEKTKVRDDNNKK